MPEAGTQRSLVAAGSVGPDWPGMGPADPENWTTRVQRVPPEERRVVDGECRADDEYGGSLGGCVAGNSSEPMAHGRVERSQARFLGARNGRPQGRFIFPRSGGLSLLPLGEGAAKRRMRANRPGPGRRSPGLRPPSPRERGFEQPQPCENETALGGPFCFRLGCYPETPVIEPCPIYTLRGYQ